VLRTPEGTNLGAKKLDWPSPLFLSLGAVFALSESTGFRKAEVALPSGCDFDDRRLRRSSLLWEINGTLHADPSPAQLRALVQGRDKAVIKPPRSKADYDGATWGAHPIWLVFDDTDVANAARWLLRLELQLPLRGGQRAEAPLFVSSAALEPILHSTVGRYLELLLSANAPEECVSAYSFHSFRIGFACALLVANCPYDMIQALARWRSDRSAAMYARLNPSGYSGWVIKAMRQTTTSRTVARMPVIDAHDAAATFQSAGTYLLVLPRSGGQHGRRVGLKLSFTARASVGRTGAKPLGRT